LRPRAALVLCLTPRRKENIMDWIDYWNRKVRKLTIFDLKFIQVGSMAVIFGYRQVVPTDNGFEHLVVYCSSHH
jgi:hypothetical protein